ncbi:hypothetical protein Airi01_085310 [Actinoallomurus iriomotensis]|uniref:SPW repeat-containing integral membrane domain-containing protein n=2 Tax=Thermomonosporaceae TaxID=2012 RepID=A0A9W6RRJ2_9ACTN|nr:hypothetical protein Airi01_085310 [Actinoallomurus iriomotensis]
MCAMSTRPMMERHPDIAELRARYDLAAERPTAQAVDGLTFLSGLYLAMSPWIVGFGGRTTLTINNLISGIAVALLAVAFVSAYGRTHGVTWVVPLIGVWTIIAPWVVSGHPATTATICSNVVVGALIVIFGALAAGVGLASRRTTMGERRF